MHTLSIGIPLGGWFAKPHVFWRGKPSQWRVLPRHENDSSDTVRLRDSHDAVMVMPMGDALCILGERLAREIHEPFFRDTTDIPFTWMGILTSTREERDDARRDLSRVEASRRTISDELAITTLALTQEQAAHQRTREQGDITERQLNLDRRLIADQRDAAQHDAQEYRGRAVCAESQLALTRNLYDEALVFLDNLVGDFEKSGRCRTHLESLRIQRGVLTFLRSHSPDTSPQFRFYSDALAIITGKIDNRERDDKKRHGRKHPRSVATPSEQ